jgi:hypothetical protein
MFRTHKKNNDAKTKVRHRMLRAEALQLAHRSSVWCIVFRLLISRVCSTCIAHLRL